MCAETARIGVMGGTFDPVHLGHLTSAADVATAFGLDRVLLVLSARPPHRNGEADAAADQRWQMLNLAARASGDARLEPCDIELCRSGPSYTVDTLKDLAKRHAGAELFLILGIDAWDEVDAWSRPGELLELANIIVTTRPGRDFPAEGPRPPVAARASARYDPAIGSYVHTSGHTIRGHRIRGVDISATDIRRRARAGLPIEHLTGDAVARCIHEHRLYGAGEAPR